MSYVIMAHQICLRSRVIHSGQELFPGQSPIDRHDILASVFKKKKLKSLMDFIVKHSVFSETHCLMYSVEW